MAKSELRKTGILRPRAYAVRVKTNSDVVVFDPMRYALGTWLLLGFKEQRFLIADWAKRNNVDYEEAEALLVQGVARSDRNGTKNLFNFGRRTRERHASDLAVKDAVSRKDLYANVKSLSADGYHDVLVPRLHSERRINLGLPNSRCIGCNDYFHHQGKNHTETTPCLHLAALETALFTDEKQKLSAEESATKLTPAFRKPWVPGDMPFSFAFFRPDMKYTEAQLQRHRILADIIMNYYVGEQENGRRVRLSQYEAGIEALAHAEIFSQTLRGAIEDPVSDNARFIVIRQEEEKIAKDSLSTADDERYAAATSVLWKLHRYFKEKGFIPIGYVREFVGTDGNPNGLIARRYIPKSGRNNRVISLLMDEEHGLPLVIGKTLGNLSADWVNASESRTESPVGRLGWKPYETTDDSSRRISYSTRVSRPEGDILSSKPTGIQVPKILEQAYKRVQEPVLFS